MRLAWGADAPAMSATMIAAWRDTVKPGDRVLHLGDFMLGPKAAWPGYRAQLTGEITLVRGNHDPTPGHKHWAHLGPLAVHAVLAFEHPRYGRIVCRHDPHEFTETEAREADVLLHGHLHSGHHREDTPAAIRAKAFCASVERLGTAPAPMRLDDFLAFHLETR